MQLFSSIIHNFSFCYKTTLAASTSGISPKSEPSLEPLEAGTRAKTSSDAHIAQSVHPQGLTFRKKANEKETKLLIESISEKSGFNPKLNKPHRTIVFERAAARKAL